jgi:hypothetical protein
MAENTKAKASVKSGLDNSEYCTKVLDGVPPKKSVEEIDKVNMPKSAPDTAGV